MPEPVELETERLRLRQWRSEDRDPFAAMNADPEVMRYFPSVLAREDSDAVADRCQALIALRGWGFWALERRSDNRFIGFVGLHEPDAALPFAPCVEIGWRLAPGAWGQGYATEAANEALAFGFNELALDEIVSFTTLANVRSRAVMARLGMVCSPETFEHPALPPESSLRTHCLYRLPSAHWLPQTPG